MILSGLFSAFRKNRVFNPSLIEQEIKEKEEALRNILYSDLDNRMKVLEKELEESIEKLSIQINSNKLRLDELHKSSKELHDKEKVIKEESNALDECLRVKRDSTNSQFLEEYHPIHLD